MRYVKEKVIEMRLIIDCFKLVKGVGKSNGIYNLTLNLVKNLVEEQSRSDDDEIKSCEILVLGNRYNREDFDREGIEFLEIKKYNPLKTLHCVRWELFGVTKMIKKLKGDRVLYPRGFCSLSHKIKDIIIVHDMIPFYYRENYPKSIKKLENFYITHRLKKSSESCAKVITISEESKKDILKYSKTNPDKITVISNGYNEIPPIEDTNKTHERYISAITSSLPHKNADGIIKSYAHYFSLTENPLRLMLIGVDSSILNSYDFDQSIKDYIVCMKYIKNNSELYNIIGKSELFVFLSLKEGFGFPPIEAMQLGVPVVCSNLSSLPEIVGDAAILVNPLNETECGHAIGALLSDSERRDKLIQSGYENIKKFHWNRIIKLYWKAILSKE